MLIVGRRLWVVGSKQRPVCSQSERTSAVPLLCGFAPPHRSTPFVPSKASERQPKNLSVLSTRIGHLMRLPRSGRVATPAMLLILLVFGLILVVGCAAASAKPTHSVTVDVGRGTLLPIDAVQVAVRVDHHRARVVLDCLVTNNQSAALSGRVRLGLPTGASPFYMAFGREASSSTWQFLDMPSGSSVVKEQEMASIWDLDPATIRSHRASFLASDAELKEAVMVPKALATRAFADTVRRGVDPALLEAVADTGEFAFSVFPLVPGQRHRIVLGYDVDLVLVNQSQSRQVNDGDFRYQLDIGLPGNAVPVRLDVNSAIAPANVSHASAATELDSIRTQPAGKGRYLTGKSHVELRADAVVHFEFPCPRDDVVALVGSDTSLAPTERTHFAIDAPLPTSALTVDSGATVTTPPDVLFLLDTSLSSGVDGSLGNYTEYLVALLGADDGKRIPRFNIMAFDVGAPQWWMAPSGSWSPNNEAGRKAAAAFAGSLRPEGATDVYAAYLAGLRGAWSTATERPPRRLVVVLLSDASPTWGEQSRAAIVDLLRESNVQTHCVIHPNSGGRASAVATSVAAASGGQLLPVDDVARSLALMAAPVILLDAVRVLDVSGQAAADAFFASPSRSLSLAGQPRVAIVGRSSAVPAQVLLHVRLPGEVNATLLVLDIAPQNRISSQTAIRAFGAAAVARLDDLLPRREEVARAYAMRYRVVGATASLLMLESAADYASFGIDPLTDSAKAWEMVAQHPVAAILSAETASRARIAHGAESLRDDVQFALDHAGVDVAIPEAVWGIINASARRSSSSSPSDNDELADGVEGVRNETTAHGAAVPREDVRRSYTAWMSDAQRWINSTASRKLSSSDERSRASLTRALRSLSSLVELDVGDAALARDVALTLMDFGLLKEAYTQSRSVLLARPHEPHTLLALASIAGELGQFDVATVWYEVAVGGDWPSHWREFNKIARVKYAAMLHVAERKGFAFRPNPDVSVGAAAPVPQTFLVDRRKQLMRDVIGGSSSPPQLVVTIQWSTDNTDVDLKVREPSGTICYYGNRHTDIGGTLTQDVVAGFGPEMYLLPVAPEGSYNVSVHYFGRDRTTLEIRTKVYYTALQDWGGPDEQCLSGTVTLDSEKHEVPLFSFHRADRRPVIAGVAAVDDLPKAHHRSRQGKRLASSGSREEGDSNPERTSGGQRLESYIMRSLSAEASGSSSRSMSRSVSSGNPPTLSAGSISNLEVSMDSSDDDATSLGGSYGRVVLVDVVPLTIGIETDCGVVLPVIQRNTQIPTRRRMYLPTVTGQTAVTITPVYGETPLLEGGAAGGVGPHPLPWRDGPASVTIADLSPDGATVAIIFDVDENSILHVTVWDTANETNKVEAISSTTRGQLFTEEDIQGHILLAEESRARETRISVRPLPGRSPLLLSCASVHRDEQFSSLFGASTTAQDSPLQPAISVGYETDCGVVVPVITHTSENAALPLVVHTRIPIIPGQHSLKVKLFAGSRLPLTVVRPGCSAAPLPEIVLRGLWTGGGNEVIARFMIDTDLSLTVIAQDAANSTNEATLTTVPLVDNRGRDDRLSSGGDESCHDEPPASPSVIRAVVSSTRARHEDDDLPSCTALSGPGGPLDVCAPLP